LGPAMGTSPWFWMVAVAIRGYWKALLPLLTLLSRVTALLTEVMVAKTTEPPLALAAQALAASLICTWFELICRAAAISRVSSSRTVVLRVWLPWMKLMGNKGKVKPTTEFPLVAPDEDDEEAATVLLLFDEPVEDEEEAMMVAAEDDDDSPVDDDDDWPNTGAAQATSSIRAASTARRVEVRILNKRIRIP